MGAVSGLEAARRRLSERGVADPLPTIALLRGIEYLCRAEKARNPELPPIPDFPSSEWAVEAANALPDVPYTTAELVETRPDRESSDPIAALRELGAQPLLNALIV